ncbi:TAXI family TRAP transporter solute-binding subunit [Paracoccus sanguinis]|uniref:TAXI family TRAP transporter solute-binding subunit n=1 Tax=Paracoccus sanguinis TaxID=1545044 RepID=UPI00051F984C|nr:TAXI family TRAP transporter solute-binding subunit [Paracoccus sanguinis]KGJ11205.1 C4-dicarboxylate ABC transporter [Paracoccus sanguinis]
MTTFTRRDLGRVALGAGALAALPRAGHARTFINILTGGTSGVYYPLGVALSQIYGAGIEGAQTQVQATKASVENCVLLDRRRGELAFILGDSLMHAAEGNAEAGFPKPLTSLRVLAAIYPNFAHLVVRQDSGIRTFADVRGHSLSVGAPASGAELSSRLMFDAAGMSYKDLSKVEYLPYSDSAELIKNRQLDGTLQSAGLGSGFIRDLAASIPITIAEVPAAVAEKMGKPFQSAVIPAGTYEGQDADVMTVLTPNYLVTHDEVPDELAYQMARLLYANLDALKAAHSAANDIDPMKAAQNLPVPLHPGAARYYQEAGVPIE